MKKLDWYILKKFLVTFFFCVFLFTIIAVVIDVSEKTDDFVKAGLSFKDIVNKYYLGFIPYIDALLFPLFVFIAVIFFTSKMALRSEIIAILASGTTYGRMLRPYWLGGILLALLLLFASSFVIPKANAKRTDFEAKYIKVNSSYDPLVNRPSRNMYFRIDSFTYAGIRNYDTTTKYGGPFFMHRINDNQLTYNLRAESLQWDTASRKWKLNNVVERTINGLHETVKREKLLLFNFNFKPADLNQDEYAKDKLNTPQLHHYIADQQLRGTEGLNTLEVEEYRRFATPFSVLVLTMIGAVVASRKVRGGSGAHLAIGFVTAAIFILMDRFSTIFSTKSSFPPLIAAWLPNLIFTFVAIYFYRKAPK
ncbi:MAG TPA: LptF/LptG family permease [Parafilimonas sp.]|nr:LptF/LptG family permease [Parafilimonas sp.]